MSAPSHGETPFTGVRIRFGSSKSIDEVIAGLLDDVGHQPVSLDRVAADNDTWDQYRAAVESHVGPSGFMLFAVLDHGAWIKKAGIEQRAVRFVIGNPLIAITMLRHDVTAGLFAPVELLVVEEPSGGSSLTYVRPSSLMVVEPNAELLSAAEALDTKLEALAAKVT
ncbi:hypothetical protein BH09ACT7_BH09ACT7_43200 [soil metagenome]